MVKRTLQEIANFFDMAVAVDEDGRTYMHKAVPYIQGGRGWLNDGMLFELPHYLVEEYSGDWRESLTLPDSWPKEPPFKEGELVIAKSDGKIFARWGREATNKNTLAQANRGRVENIEG